MSTWAPIPLRTSSATPSRTVRTGKREAQRVLNEMISEAERGLSVRTSATVGDLLEQWFDFAARDFSPKTVKETRGFIDRNLLPALGTVPLSKLKAGDLDRFYRKLSVDGESRSGPLAPGTVRRIHGILRRALGQGLKWGWIGCQRRQPGCRDHAAACASARHQSTVLRRSGTPAPSSRCDVARTRVLSHAVGCDWGEAVRDRRAAME